METIKSFGSQNFKDYQYEIDHGGKFVEYDYCISLLFVTLVKSSPVYLVRGFESTKVKGLKYTLISFIVGWWGIPFGPIYTIRSIFLNLNVGRDVTYEVMQSAEELLNPMNQYF